MTRTDRRFNRQIARLQHALPGLGATLTPGSRLRRPVALGLILGGMLGFLPVVGFWMLPLGLVLLAVDVPALRPTAAAAMIRSRLLGRRLRRRKPGQGGDPPADGPTRKPGRKPDPSGTPSGDPGSHAA